MAKVLLLKVGIHKQAMSALLRITQAPPETYRIRIFIPGSLYAQQSLKSTGLGESKVALGMLSAVKTEALHLMNFITNY